MIEILDQETDIGASGAFAVRPEREQEPVGRVPLAERRIEMRRPVVVVLLDELDVQQGLIEPLRLLEVVNGDIDHHDSISLGSCHRDSFLDEVVQGRELVPQEIRLRKQSFAVTDQALERVGLVAPLEDLLDVAERQFERAHGANDPSVSHLIPAVVPVPG